MNPPNLPAACLTVLSLLALISGVHGQSNIVTPTSATSTTTIGGSRTIDTTIDGSDLSGGGTSGDILSETHDKSTDSAGYWLSGNGAGNDTTEVITYTLAEPSTVDSVHFWQYNRDGDNPGRAIRTFDISFSTDGGSTFPTTIAGATLGDFLYNQNGMPTVDGEIPVQSKTFTTQTGVTHIRLTNIINYGNAYIGFSEIRFGAPDVTAPGIVPPTSPADDETDVVVSTDLVATFDEDIALVDDGTITIRNLGPSGDPDEVITIPDARLTVSGAELTIDPASNLAAGNNYAVRISGDAIEDLAGNAFAGISNDTDWNFQTAADATPPSLVLPTIPADDAIDVPTDADLVATFDEPILAGTGNITLKNLSNATDTVIPVGDPQVTVSGSELTIDLAANLDPGDDYAVQIDAGVVTDAVGNPFAGILAPDVTTWSFTTAADVTPPQIASLAPEDNSTGIAQGIVLLATFNEPVTAGVAPVITLLDEDFESGNGGFTVATTSGSDWEHGTPDSSSPGGTIGSGNGAASGEGSAWGTNLGAFDGGAGDPGFYESDPDDTVTCLRSEPIDLTGVSSASLGFAHARDLAPGDTAVVNLIDDTTDTVVAAAVFTATNESSGWSTVSDIDLAGGIGQVVRIEWCLTGTGGGSDDFLGWYIDDVSVTASGITDSAITLRNLSKGTETIFAPDDPAITITGDTLTIDPSAELDAGDEYAVRIGPDAITDLSGNSFAGIADDTTWNFSVAAGSVVITPSSATATSDIGGSRTIERTIDGSDLSSGGASGDILSETHANNDSNDGGYWLSANTGGNVAGEVLTYALAEATEVNEVHIWGYERLGDTSRSIRNFDLSFSTDGGATFPTTIPAATLGDFVQPGDPITVQTKAFAPQSGVTHIRISNITNFGDGNYVGLSEIRFGGPAGAAGGNDFSDWIAGFDVGAESGLNDDPDGDGIDNGVENFFGTLPDEFSQGLVSGTVDTGAGTFTFTHPQGTLADDLTATYRWSTDLMSFHNDGDSAGGVTVDFTTEADTPEAGTTKVTATITGAAVDRLFVDVEVTQP